MTAIQCPYCNREIGISVQLQATFIPKDMRYKCMSTRKLLCGWRGQEATIQNGHLVCPNCGYDVAADLEAMGVR